MHPYQVDGEVGRYVFTTHSVIKEGKIEDNSAQSVFPELKGKEWYRTSGFKEIAMTYGVTRDSYRKTSKLINRIRYQEGATPLQTLRDNAEAEGDKIINFVEFKSKKILEDNRFTEEGVPRVKVGEYGVKEPKRLGDEEISKAIKRCEKDRGVNRVEIGSKGKCYEDPQQTVNISIDDVGVKRQKESRREASRGDKDNNRTKYVHNTIVHVEKGESSYVLNGYGVVNVIRILIAFLLNNKLLGYRLQFFTDGQKTLKLAILKAFSWYRNIGIILDWYHLEKRCKEKLSLGMKGHKIREEVLIKLMPLLWSGGVDKAIKLLKDLDESLIKAQGVIEELIGYLERNKPDIPCYAVRKELGLRNSSNIGEKMNDLVVSDRQKHNGMSWSMPGSVGLASITVLTRNNEHKRWFEEGNLEFKLAA